MDLSPNERFVMADVPGLIEGASEGAGLGTRFLGHLERTAVLIHLVDSTTSDPVEDWRTIRAELEAYGPELAVKPELLALNKADALDDDLRRMISDALEEATGVTPFLVSGVSGEGVTVLLRAAFAKVRERDAPVDQDAGAWSP